MMSDPRDKLETTHRPGVPGSRPLCVDLDGTLSLTDTFLESVLLLLRTRPLALFLLPWWLLRGRAYCKARLAGLALAAPDNLPYHRGVLDLLDSARTAGQPIYLVSGTSQAVAEAVAAHIGGFAGVIATGTEGRNLTGKAKRDELVRRFGRGGFDYAGNARPDLAVWDAAARKIVVEPTAPVRRALRRGVLKPDAILQCHPPGLGEWLRVLRPRQWSKNLLIFIPYFASHQMSDESALVGSILCFCAFCFASSSIYLVNDLLDLESDRKHVQKRNRGFASGHLPLWYGIAAAPPLAAAALGLAALTGIGTLALTAGYLLLSNAYSLALKRIPVADVVLLASLYTLRIFAGGAASSISISPWLASLSLFLFLSLAMAKRCSELFLRQDPANHSVPGRGYVSSDLTVVQSLGTSSGCVATLVLALYVYSEMGHSLYARPQWLWLLVPLLAYWIGRLWLFSARGQLDADPVEFALRDHTGWWLLAVAALIVLLSGPR